MFILFLCVAFKYNLYVSFVVTFSRYGDMFPWDDLTPNKTLNGTLCACKPTLRINPGTFLDCLVASVRENM